MAEGRAVRENPELFRIILLNAIEEITACMSDTYTSTLHKEQSGADNLQNHLQILQSDFQKSVSELLNNMWEELEISSKVSFIHQLESNNPSDITAWRSSTGEVPMLNLRGHYLTDTKEHILYKLIKCEAESEKLKETLHTKKTALRKSAKKICKSEQPLMNLYNDCEKIIRGDG